jgi:predicted transcriptional regulator
LTTGSTSGIERGEQDIEDGKILSHEEVESKLAKWLR